MKIANEPGCLSDELLGWTVRGLLCAGPSFFWAWMGGFDSLFEIAAMLAGISVYVYAFARFSTMGDGMSRNRTEWVVSLKIAVAIKMISPLLPVSLAFITTRGHEEDYLFASGLPDLWLGALSMFIVRYVGRLSEDIELGLLDSFGWTGLTTLVQGALITILLLLLALVVRGIRLAWRYLRQKPEFGERLTLR